MWDTFTTRDQKNNEIVKTQALIYTLYNPNKPITSTYKVLKDGMFLLQRLKAPVAEEEVIRNFMFSLSEHKGFERVIRWWNKFCEESAVANSIVTVIWKY